MKVDMKATKGMHEAKNLALQYFIYRVGLNSMFDVFSEQ